MSEDPLDKQDLQMEEIKRLIIEFKEKFEAGTRSAESFMTLMEIEKMWGELQDQTNKIYSDMLQDLLSQVDERDLIRKKKKNTSPTESD